MTPVPRFIIHGTPIGNANILCQSKIPILCTLNKLHRNRGCRRFLPAHRGSTCFTALVLKQRIGLILPANEIPVREEKYQQGVRRLTKEIYCAEMNGCVGRGRLRRKCRPNRGHTHEKDTCSQFHKPRV